MAFFGGSLTRRGRLGGRPNGDVFFKTEILLEKLVRYDLLKISGISIVSDQELSTLLKRSVSYINALRAKPAYLRKRIELTTGISPSLETQVTNSAQKHKQMMRLMLPDAMRAIADVLQKPANSTAEMRLKMEVARDVMDREGSLPKISRTDSHVQVEHDFTSTDGVSRELLEALAEDAAPSKESISSLLQVNKAFTNSETLSKAEQEEAMRTLELVPPSFQNQLPN